MKIPGLVLLFAGLLAATPAALLAGNPANGKTLHDTNCIACHASLMDGNPTAIFTRPNSIIHSFDSLNKRVRFCETVNGMNWNDEQVGDVVDYLNEEFYKFN